MPPHLFIFDECENLEQLNKILFHAEWNSVHSQIQPDTVFQHLLVEWKEP